LTAFLGYSPKWYKLNYKYYNNKQTIQHYKIKVYYIFNKISKRYSYTITNNKTDIDK
jgi:Rad3-related DNA helicase